MLSLNPAAICFLLHRLQRRRPILFEQTPSISSTESPPGPANTMKHLDRAEKKNSKKARVMGSSGDVPVEGNKRRKQSITECIEEVGEDCKFSVLDQVRGQGEVSFPWRNFHLVSSLQDKNNDQIKKVEMAFQYVRSSNAEYTSEILQCPQIMDNSRTIGFLNNWIQSVLISSEKKTRTQESKPDFGTPGSFLDIKCWKILHFCLEESKGLHFTLNSPKDFLRVIHVLVVEALSYVNTENFMCREFFSHDRLHLYDVVLDSISLVFSFHGGVANENLDMWILLMDKVIELVLKIVAGEFDDSKTGDFFLKLACYLFESFANFLKIHPTRKSGFQTFIDELLEPLLHLLHILVTDSLGINTELRPKLYKLVEDVLAHGLFHPTHIDGFLNLQSTARYKDYSGATVKEERPINKSYHRHLFNKVEKMVAKKNKLALSGLGELLHLFVSRVSKHQRDSVSAVGSWKPDLISSIIVPNKTSARGPETSTKITVSHSKDAELQKFAFDFFVQILEYLLADVNKYVVSEGDAVSKLLNVPDLLLPINNLLSRVIIDRIYQRTEDTSEGASKFFLKFIYDTVLSISSRLAHENTSFSPEKRSGQELLLSVRKELMITVNNLLNIEYEAVGQDIECLWTLVFSSVGCCSCLTDIRDPSLPLEILSLGCRLIDLYSELRQVDSCIFALCRALRHHLSLDKIEAHTPSGSLKSLSIFLCSSEFRVSFSNAVKAIPEGRVAECVQQLGLDIMESLKWIRVGHEMYYLDEIQNPNQLSFQFHLQAEILGKVLSELYILILDSITVTAGNSHRVGVCLKDLIDIIRPSLSSIVSQEFGNSKVFSILVDGQILKKRTEFDNLSMSWILVLLFRLLLSSRALSRELISLMAQKASKNMSEVMGDSVIFLSGRDWFKVTGSTDQGFFSCILQPSSALLTVIHVVSDICVQDSVVHCPSLVYVLNIMALQRLADLNRLIEYLNYTLQWKKKFKQLKLDDDADLALSYLEKCCIEKKNEAAGLTKFMLGFMDAPSFGLIPFELMDHIEALKFPVGSLNEKSFPCALWSILFRDVDIWYSHAVKKDLKNFLRLPIQASLSCIHDHDYDFRVETKSRRGNLKKVFLYQLALKILSNTKLDEQKFACRYMASRLCRFLEKSVSSLFPDLGVKLSMSPDWVEVISTLERSTHFLISSSTQTKPNSVLEDSSDRKGEFLRCRFLLNILIQMPEEIWSLESSSLYITYILNLERILVDNLLGVQSSVRFCNPYMSFQLFADCRKVLQKSTLSFRQENVFGTQSLLTSKIGTCPLPLLWIVKSVLSVWDLQYSFLHDLDFTSSDAVFSLLDRTSNLVQRVCRHQFELLLKSNIMRKTLNHRSEGSELSEGNLVLTPEEKPEVWISISQLVGTLEEHLQQSLTTLKDVDFEKEEECLPGFQNLTKLSSVVACIQGLLWGLASAFGETSTDNSDHPMNFSSSYTELMTRINSCISKFLEFGTFIMKAIFVDDDATVHTPACDGKALGASESYSDSCDGISDRVASDMKCGLIKVKSKRKSCLSIPDLRTFLTEVVHWKLCLKKSVLLQIFRGENTQAAFILQQMCVASSAILRLNLQLDLSSMSWDIFPIMVDISQFLLMEFSRNGMPQHQIFRLDCIIKFLEELGSYFPHFDPFMSRDLFVDLVTLHLRIIGKSICLQGKESKLASQETDLHADRPINRTQSGFSAGTSQLDELKKSSRISFKSYAKKSTKFHLLSALQAIERALVGVEEGLKTHYEIVCDGSDGGKISSIVAAAIDGLDMILESVSGPKRLNIIKRNIGGLVSCLFNIILHVRGPNNFYINSLLETDFPDSGSVVLMCIEVLTKIFQRPARFPIDSYHIPSSLHVPGSLFHYFLELHITEARVKGGPNQIGLNTKFSVELYIASCRMLSTAIKYHRNETQQSIALLENSSSVLLHCLEIVHMDGVTGKGFLGWETVEAVECASGLRRVYEEVRQQKDVFGKWSSQFLSHYIWVYCGLGPARKGIIREVDEALRPGVYALIDSCSPDDLQFLHTGFGEGPCRSTLAALQHDYKINFQFQGKV